mgnify:CR=1 FL=1
MRKTLQKYSAFSILLMLVVLIALCSVVLNLTDDNADFADMTTNHLYTLSPVTLDLLASMDSDIYIYATEGSSGGNDMIARLLSVYKREGSHLTVESLDPATNSGLMAQFEIPTTDSEYVVVSNKSKTRSKVMSAESMFITDDNGIPTYFRGEQMITGAIQYVLTGAEQHIAVLTGHGETSRSSISLLLSSLNDLGYEARIVRSNSLSLSSENDVLLIMAPSMDLSESDASYIRDFLSKGGRAVITKNNVSLSDDGGLDLSAESTPNLDAILASYGLSVNQDLIISDDISGSSLRPTRLVIGGADADGGIVIDECSSIAVREDVNRKLRITTLLSTDDTYYAKDISKGRVDTLTKNPDDLSGPFVLGALAEKNGSAIALFTSTTFMCDNDISIMGNKSLILNVFASLMRRDEVLTPAYKALTISSSVNMYSFPRYMWMFLFVIIIPTVIIFFGVITWSRIFRKK